MSSKERGDARCLSEYIRFGDTESVIIPEIDIEAFKESNQYYTLIIDRTQYIAGAVNGQMVENPCYGWTYVYNPQTSKYELYSFRSEQFRTEIAAKSVLAGVSQYIVRDSNKFNYQLGETDTTYSNVVAVQPSVDIEFKFKDDASGGKQATYKLKEGESILFSRPSLIEETQYGSYVRYYYKGTAIPSKADYELKGSDKLVLYYKLNDTDSFYTTAVFKSGTIICPSFSLEPTSDISDPGIAPASLPESIPMTNAQNTISIKKINKT